MRISSMTITSQLGAPVQKQTRNLAALFHRDFLLLQIRTA